MVFMHFVYIAKETLLSVNLALMAIDQNSTHAYYRGTKRYLGKGNNLILHANVSQAFCHRQHSTIRDHRLH